ncbi:hypothetical protein EB093_09485 [bacterium]|nr:hypothetical protein [bacterium]
MNSFLRILAVSVFLQIAVGMRQLAFSGGGAFGAVEIGILKRIQESAGAGGAFYDLYTGISAGGLNAGFLSFFEDISVGIRRIESLYGSFRNRQIYTVLPPTGISLLNTEPLRQTIRTVVERMPNPPAVHTLIGATNLYTGQLDVFAFSELAEENQTELLMATSAIPVVFPPVKLDDALYADGGTLSNELLAVFSPPDGSYLNITYITTSDWMPETPYKIESIRDMVKRTFQIVGHNFNNPLAILNQNCVNPVGEVNQWFVAATYLADYDELDFEHGEELVKIGYTYAERKNYKIC